MQMPLPIHIEPNATILHCPIVEAYFDDQAKQIIEIVGGRFAGQDYIYLAHLDRPLHRVQHYLGSTKDLRRRKKEHQRQYPSFRFSDTFFTNTKHGLDFQVLAALEPLRGKTFRRYHTLESALRKHLGNQATLYKFSIMSATRQHTSNGILMAANRCNIPWRIVRVFQADRSLERALKNQKLSFRRICPACQGDESPF